MRTAIGMGIFLAGAVWLFATVPGLPQEAKGMELVWPFLPAVAVMILGLGIYAWGGDRTRAQTEPGQGS
ncbi:hypothetical protein [Ectothiorhodospira mobilis]|uniref:hypothetical protein n=1 Tax=Ectothiorhodospira mobilis TaxID=195064 RepID=UPI001160AEF3|nr:hypothetical protein [Ectothiorhodospira mobilis]MCG5535388.1 hypothetical protein [Ectothiorhodospira mobilis]